MIDQRTLKSFQAITDFCVTGKCPDGVRPEVMSALADIVAAFPDRKYAPDANELEALYMLISDMGAATNKFLPWADDLMDAANSIEKARDKMLAFDPSEHAHDLYVHDLLVAGGR